MSSLAPFDEFLAKLRGGDESAIRQFVADYEPFIRRTLRTRIARAGLRPAADSADVCQSALGTFLIHVAAGDFELKSRQDLEKLLFSIARKKFALLARHEYAERRDRNRTRPLQADHDSPARPREEPVQLAIHHDFLEQVGRRLPAEERKLYSLRQQGKSWDEIAAQAGVDAVLLRKRLSRALIQVAVELGLEDGDE